MSLHQRYLRYLEHLGETCTVSDLAGNVRRSGVALRHDVDHDLDLALDMAFWEREHGRRATYYLLHTAPYWDDPKLIDACLQLQDYGHEVGLHLNVLGQWWVGDIDDPSAHLANVLATLRDAGVNVVGTAAHGEKLCYEAGFINYWLFCELRGANPSAVESGLSAEGVPDPHQEFSITYPSTEVLTRPDGEAFSLWSISMRDMGLKHEAVRVPVDGYFTDSGGGWTRSIDPLEADVSNGRHQVLIHPEYWRGPQRIVFFLSTARSGSKWLATVLEQGTSATVKHEFSLNHRYRDELVEEKRTGLGARDLLEDAPMVRRLLAEARAWIETLSTDYFEANVYLAHAIEQLREVNPDALFVHLHRDPHDVVRSLLNRDWYDTPNDDRHPRIDQPGWDAMDQLEQCAWYVRDTGQRLRALTDNRLPLEDITSDPEELRSRLAPLGIAFHPRLATDFGEIVNASETNSVGAFSSWPRNERRRLDAIVAGERREQGYRRGRLEALRSIRDWLPQRKPRESAATVVTPFELADLRGADLIDRVRSAGCRLEISGGDLIVMPDGNRHGNVRFGGGGWHQIEGAEGWATPADFFVSGVLHADTVGPGIARLICLSYDADGVLLARRDVANVTRNGVEFSFRPRPDAVRWDLALYMAVDSAPEQVTIRRLGLIASPRIPQPVLSSRSRR